MKLTPLLANMLLLVVGGCKSERAEAQLLWPEGAPGSESRQNEPERAQDWWVKNVHRPSLTVFKPRLGTANGAAVVIVPGGGHEQLVFEPEAVAPARFLAKQGLTAFALKYRLAREQNSPYSVMEHARADCLRAIRWVRAHAAEYRIDPQRVGVMGWSAGAELAALASYGEASGEPSANDPIDRHSARPDFQIAIYPGPLGVVERLPADAPPAFLLAASDDEQVASTVRRLLGLYQEASLPVEVHLFAKGGHAFNMGERSDNPAIRHWPDRLADWLRTLD
jgi:acetyl esterase/lipase